mgnify:CR=1 FL=1
MKILNTLIAVCLFSVSAANADTIPNVCYEKLGEGQFCTTENIGKVQVFIFNAGWCGPCNSEVSQLSRDYTQFAEKPVVFASLSGEGYSRGTPPDQTFLKSWQKKHNIPFVVAGKKGDFGTHFGANGYIPFAAIIDKEGNLAESGNLEASAIVQSVKRLLNE